MEERGRMPGGAWMAEEDCLPGAKEKGVIYGTGAWQIGEIKNTPAFQKAYELGKQVA